MSARLQVREVWEGLLDVLYPPWCAGCGRTVRQRAGLCSNCEAALPWISAPVCALCGAPLPVGVAGTCEVCSDSNPAFRAGRSALQYDGAVCPVLKAWKYRGQRYYDPLLREWMCHFARTLPASRYGSLDALIPIPLHPDRLRWRGFNQAALLAMPLAGQWELPVWQGALVRTRPTPPQQRTRSRKDRLNNLHGAFLVPDPALIAGRRLCLIDDVATTGATLHACAQALRQAGARSITFLTLARQMPGKPK